MKKILIQIIFLNYLFAIDYVNSIGMKFKEIHSGNFLMGTSASVNTTKDETPLHTVNIKSFYIAESEVTQGQWYEIMKYNPSFFKIGDKNLPVEKVSWDEANDFINRLNKRERTTKYRLPTEEEWEYAARADTTTMWYCGDNELCTKEIAIVGKNATNIVKSKRPNNWGIYDMSGNVWEWTASCWSYNYNSIKKCKYKVVRGGSGFSYPYSVRSANRYNLSPYSHRNDVGFRVVMSK